MHSKLIFKEVDIKIVALDHSGERLHKHTHYQLIYIMEGSGTHIFNGHHLPFAKSDVFLLRPGDSHAYRITTSSSLCIIDFTANYFAARSSAGENKHDFNQAFKALEKIFYHQYHLPGQLVQSSDKALFDMLIMQLLNEEEKEHQFYHIVIQNIIFLLLTFAARTIVQQGSTPAEQF